MISKILEVKNKTGLHARPISQIIKVEIEIDREDENEVLKELEELFYSNFGE